MLVKCMHNQPHIGSISLSALNAIYTNELMKAEPEFWGIIDRTEVQQMTGEKNRSLLLHANGGGKGIVFFDNFGGPEKGRLVRLW
jgi:hypothetical protein